MSYKTNVAVSSEIHTKHVRPVWAECGIGVLNLVVHTETTRL